MVVSYLLMTLLGFSGLFLIGLVLLQRGRGGGFARSISGHFENVWGPKAGDLFTRLTVVAFVVWALLSGSSAVALHQPEHVVKDSVFKSTVTEQPGHDQDSLNP